MDDPNATGEGLAAADPDTELDEGSEDELPDVAEHDVGEEATDDEIDEGEGPEAGAGPAA